MARSVRPGRVLAILAAAAVLTTFAGYLMLLDSEGPQPESLATAIEGAPTWLLAVIAGALAAIIAAIPRSAGRARRILLMGSAIALTITGVLAIFSIGMGLILAGVLAALAAGADGRPRPAVSAPRAR